MVRQSSAVTGPTGQDILGNCNTNPQRQPCLVRGPGFKDDPVTAEAENRHWELKSRILTSVRNLNVKRYQKTQEELNLIKKKHV